MIAKYTDYHIIYNSLTPCDCILRINNKDYYQLKNIINLNNYTDNINSYQNNLKLNIQQDGITSIMFIKYR